MGEWVVTVGDCRDVLAGLEPQSVDAVVCDPPYELTSGGKGGFMGKAWDGTGVAFDPAMWAEVLRVLKPGGHLLAFGGTRTFHRMTVAIEDAGFEVRDCLSWLYGSGFPKSLNVGKAIDKAAGAEREVVGSREVTRDLSGGSWSELHGKPNGATSVDVTAPATPEAARWEGWGTALKPAWEPIVMARKRLCGTVAGNVLAHGTGGLNIDGSRIGFASDDDRSSAQALGDLRAKGRRLGVIGEPGQGQSLAVSQSGDTRNGSEAVSTHHAGRWPANVLLDEGAAAALDEQTGVSVSNVRLSEDKDEQGATWALGRSGRTQRGHADSGGASRFFYVAKASRRDRNEGLDGMPEKRTKSFEGGPIVSAEHPGTSDGGSRVGANHHPTVKPTALMRHLVRLVTPPGGLVLDPFTGSGSTGKAAVLEGFRFHGIEQDAQYAEIARARIAWAEAQVDAEQPTLM